MEDSRSVETETEVEVEHYEDIVGDLNYTTLVVSRPSRSISYLEDTTTAATFKGPITHSSESTVITSSASAAIVGSVTWPYLRSPCSIAAIIKCRGRLRSFATLTRGVA